MTTNFQTFRSGAVRGVYRLYQHCPWLDAFRFDHSYRCIAQLGVIHNINGFSNQWMLPGKEVKVISCKSKISFEGTRDSAFIKKR